MKPSDPLVVFVALGLFSAMVVGGIGPVSAAGGEPVDVIVVFEDASAVNATAIERVGGAVTGGHDVSVVPVLFARLPPDAIEALANHPAVVEVERNRMVQQTGQSTPWGVERIGARSAEAAVGRDAQAAVQVAVIDTGVDAGHEDLGPNVAWGANTVGTDAVRTGTEAASDDNGHGTVVSGVVAARDNSRGVVGVAPHVELYAIKSLGANGTGRTIDVIEGIDAALKGPDGTFGTDDDADVISMSFGSSHPSEALRRAVANASDRAVLVGAAGNDGDGDPTTDEVSYPAAFPSVIAVAATNTNDGTPTWSSEGQAVELAAPGVTVRTTALGGYAWGSGTSVATPHVAGTAALLIAKDLSDGQRDRSPDWVRDRLQETAHDLGVDGRDNHTGYGLVHAADAVGVAANDQPAVSILAPKPGATVGGNVTVRAEVTDTEDPASALTVEVSIDDGPWRAADYHVGTDEFRFEWDTRSLKEDAVHTVRVRATDTGGRSATADVDVTVSNEASPPSVSITAPSNASRVDGVTDIRITADDAEDDSASLNVAVSVDDGPWRSATFHGILDEYQFAWNTTGAAEDSGHELSVRAIDSSGLEATDTVRVVVDNRDNPPSVQIQQPANGSTVAGTTRLVVTASDDRTPPANLTARFRVDESNWRPLTFDSESGRFVGTWDTADASDGPQTITVELSDGRNAVREQRAVTVANSEATSPVLNLTATAGTVTPGTAVTVGFSLTNTGEDDRVVGLQLTLLPAEWAVVDQTSEGGQWSANRRTWFWVDPLPVNATVDPSVTLCVPNGTDPGEYAVGGAASDSDGQRAGATATVQVQSGPDPVSVIAGDDGIVEFDEVLVAIAAFNSGTSVPDPGGPSLTFQNVLRVIHHFNTGEPVTTSC